MLGDGGTLAADFVVDVGSSLAVALTKPLVDANNLRQRVGPTIGRPSGRGADGLSWAEIGRVKQLRIGSVELAAPVVSLYGDSAGVFSTGRYFQGNIGGVGVQALSDDRITLEPIVEPEREVIHAAGPRRLRPRQIAQIIIEAAQK